MTKFGIKNIIIHLCIVLSFTSIFSQQKTGNIVEYFGKEKVNEIQEGDLFHVFQTGLTLKIPTYNFNSASFPEDPVFNKFLYDAHYSPQSGDVFDIDFIGEQIAWKTVETDSTNSFNDRSLRSSYVYLSYKSNVEKNVLFEASGHSLILINGLPHEGDHYDFGYNLIPLKLKKGINVFVLKVGRFPRVRARMIEPSKDVQFTTRDLTMPDLQLEEKNKAYLGAIRIVNSSNAWLKNYTVEADLSGSKKASLIPDIAPMSVRKVPFTMLMHSDINEEGETELSLQLFDQKKSLIDTEKISLQVKSKYKHHKNTLLSNIDGSVQYYSVAPSTDTTTKEQALFLSVHGASVEAVNQANAYKKKDWGTLVAQLTEDPLVLPGKIGAD